MDVLAGTMADAALAALEEAIGAFGAAIIHRFIVVRAGDQYRNCGLPVTLAHLESTNIQAAHFVAADPGTSSGEGIKLNKKQMNTGRNRMRGCRLLALTLGMTAGVAAPGWADTIVPPPAISGVCSDGTSTSDAGTTACAGGSISISTEPFAAVTANFVGGGSHGSGGAGGTAMLMYDVIVNGGSPGDAVPLTVQAVLSTNSLGGDGSDVTNASASIGLTFANGNQLASQSVFCGNVLRGEDCSNSQWSGTLSAFAWVGYDNLVGLSVTADIAGAGFAQAYADPFISIDPAFAAANPQYSLSLNVSNDLAPSPEPSGWVLMAGAGGAWLVVSSRRRRATA